MNVLGTSQHAQRGVIMMLRVIKLVAFSLLVANLEVNNYMELWLVYRLNKSKTVLSVLTVNISIQLKLDVRELDWITIYIIYAWPGWFIIPDI